MNVLAPITDGLGFTPSLELQADMTRLRLTRSAWDEMANAALDFDTDRFDRAKADFRAAQGEC